MVYRSRLLRVPIVVAALVLLAISLWLMLGGCSGSSETFTFRSAPASGPVGPMTIDRTLDSDDTPLAVHIGSPWLSGDHSGNGLRATPFGESIARTAFGPGWDGVDGPRFAKRPRWLANGCMPIASTGRSGLGNGAGYGVYMSFARGLRSTSGGTTAGRFSDGSRAASNT